MQNKIKILHVVPTLKRDGAEVQLSKIFKQFKHVDVELFTFDMYEKGDSIIGDLGNTKITSARNKREIKYYRNFY